MVYFYGLNVVRDCRRLARLGVTAGAVMFGFFGPDIFVKNAIDKRRSAIRKGLPDALDLMVICAEAGVSLDAHSEAGVRGVRRAPAPSWPTNCS